MPQFGRLIQVIRTLRSFDFRLRIFDILTKILQLGYGGFFVLPLLALSLFFLFQIRYLLAEVPQSGLRCFVRLL